MRNLVRNKGRERERGKEEVGEEGNQERLHILVIRAPGELRQEDTVTN